MELDSQAPQDYQERPDSSLIKIDTYKESATKLHPDHDYFSNNFKSRFNSKMKVVKHGDNRRQKNRS